MIWSARTTMERLCGIDMDETSDKRKNSAASIRGCFSKQNRVPPFLYFQSQGARPRSGSPSFPAPEVAVEVDAKGGETVTDVESVAEMGMEEKPDFAGAGIALEEWAVM